MFFLSFGMAQAQEEIIDTKNKPFSTGLHYTGNFRNDWIKQYIKITTNTSPRYGRMILS